MRDISRAFSMPEALERSRVHYWGSTPETLFNFLLDHSDAAKLVYRESDGRLLYADYWPSLPPVKLGDQREM